MTGRGARSFLSRLQRHAGAAAVAELRLAGELAVAAGSRAYLVGGVVRDLWLGRRCDDLDLVVEGDAAALARELASRLRGRLRLHSRFLTATVERAHAKNIDLGTARRETYPRPAALPHVEVGDLEQDLLRRDFTINAMAVRLDPERFGELIDPAGGLADLRAARIRVLHDRSFIDDPTRGFRALRFAVRLGFHLSKRTARLLAHAVASDVFDRLINFKISAAALFATEELMDHFYEVDAQFVRSDRPEYDAEAGYLGARFSFDMKRKFGSRVTGFLKTSLWNFTGSTNSDSPLSLETFNYGVVAGFKLALFQSDERVHDDEY